MSSRAIEFSRGHGIECTIFAIFVSSMVYVFGITGGNFTYLLSIQGLFILWVFLSILMRSSVSTFSESGVSVLVILALVLCSNLVVNHANYGQAEYNLMFSVAHVLGVLVFAAAVQWATSNLEPQRIFRTIALLLLPLVAVAFLVGAGTSGLSRAAPFGVHPNWWGEVAFGYILCSLAYRKWTVKIAFVAVGLSLMILVESRGALLGSIVSIALLIALQFRPFGHVAAQRLALFASVIGAIVAVLIVTDSWVTIYDFIRLEVFLLDDPYRGLDSNLAGRLDGWREAADVFASNPIFGQGLDTLSDVHNGFLRWAGEGGLLLLGVMLALIAWAFVRSWKTHDDWAVAALSGILVYMMTYPRALNLNIVGIILMFSLFRWRDDDLSPSHQHDVGR